MTIESQTHMLLPTYPTPLVGRDRELSELTHLLRQSDYNKLNISTRSAATRIALEQHLL